MADTTVAKPETSAAPQLAVHRIYVKSSSFEAVAITPTLLNEPPKPLIDMQAQVLFTEREPTLFEVVLTMHLTGKVAGNLLWQVKLQQAGLYTLQNVEEEQRKQILNGFCMNQLYPYACEKVSSMVVDAGFPPAYLSPMNFEALYREQQQQEAKRVAEAAESVVQH